jgi:metallo-beta-lactamase family protein
MDKRISFLGAARNVTGSRYLVELGKVRVLVDCGLHQERDLKERDFKPFPVPPASIQAVLLTHAHLDHCGYLPKLVRDGFKGKIYCTAATAEVARILLVDSAFLQEEDARFKRKRHDRQGRQPKHGYEPLYTIEDAEACAPHFEPVPLLTPVPLGRGLHAVFREAGHILGSASIRVSLDDDGERCSILFSGDVGRPDKPILNDPSQFDAADFVVVESTYGEREHEGERDIPTELAAVVNDTVSRGGNLIIPSFAVERAHELLYHLSELMKEKRIPPLLTFLDSPMALDVTRVFERHPELFDSEMRARVSEGDSPFEFPQLVRCRTAKQSKAINTIKGTVIVIAGSGMCVGGRIKHHLALHVSRPESTILFVGYQAAGTLGRQLADGAPLVRILGTEHEVRARVARISGLSAHADRRELLAWLSALRRPPRRIFVTHGDHEAAVALGEYLTEQAGWQTVVPSYRETHVLN